MRLNDFGAQLLCLVGADVFSSDAYRTSDLESKLCDIANQAVRHNPLDPAIDSEIRQEFETAMRNLKSTVLAAGVRRNMRVQLVTFIKHAPLDRTLLRLLAQVLTDKAFSDGIFDTLFPGTHRQIKGVSPINGAPKTPTTTTPQQSKPKNNKLRLSDIPNTLSVSPSSTHTSPRTPGSQGEVEPADGIAVLVV